MGPATHRNEPKMASVAKVKQDIHNESCIGKLLKINAFVIYCTFLLHSCILQNLTLSLREEWGVPVAYNTNFLN